MIEFIVSLVAILVVAAGMFLLAELIRADTKSSVDATGEAISKALSFGFSTAFTAIEDWEAGRDGMRYTKDDRKRTGNFGRVRTGITDFTSPSGRWAGVPRLDGAGVRYGDIVLSSTTMSFMRGRGEETVETLPVMQSLMGLPPELTLRNEVWMPETGGLY